MIIFNQVINFINEHTWASIISFTIITYIIFLLIYKLFEILNSINKLIKENIMKYQIRRTDHLDMVTMQLSERIELTNSIFNLIDDMIHEEILSFMKTFISLPEKYQILNLDIDVGKISTIIYEAFNKDIFLDPNVLITQEYMMSYITKKTSYELLIAVLAHNENINNANKLINDSE